MARLLVVNSSIQGERSVSRGLTQRATDAWLQAHPDGEVRHRDLVAEGPAHFTPDAHTARFTAVDDRTAAQVAEAAVANELAQEVRDADTLILGVPLYNWNVPTTLKAWIDHLLASPLVRDPAGASQIAGLEVVLAVSRGGSYAPGTPREGWDHATPWLLHVFETLGIEPRLVVAEMTLAEVNPALAQFKEMGRESLRAAQEAADGLWGEGSLQATA